jgi:phosphomannomutase / phosphoglucomutase
MSIPLNIFRGYDIRGLTGTELTPELMYTLGKAYATFLYRRQIRHCVVGRDMRETSEEYQKAFTDGLLESGINVIDIGLSLTQIIYFAQYHYLSKGAAMITASHNPIEFNGLKLGIGFSDTLVTKEIKELAQIAESQNFNSWETKGEYRKDDVFAAYKTDLFNRIPVQGKIKLKVVIDSSCTTTGVFLPQILREAGCEVIEQNTNLDPTFPLGTPDPTEKHVLERLAKRVKEEKADLGLTYDSDGDRVGIVDENGTLIWNDVLAALFAQDILHYLPNSPIVFNVLCSKSTSDAIKAAGGQPIMWLVGHSFIKSKVKEERAPFGGELSGHFFFMDNFYGHDDGAFSTLRLLQYLNRTGQSLSQAVSALPQYVSSPEIKLGLADEIKFTLIKEELSKDIKNLFPQAEYVEIDGIRADTETQMVVIRASQNGPYITIKFEGKTQEEYDNLKIKIRDILKKYSQIDWAKGVNTDAFE